MQVNRLTESSLASIYGCCGLFDLCDNADLMSLSFEGQSKFLDWIGWTATDKCVDRRAFLAWVRPETAEGGGASAGYTGDPCAPANSVEFGVCEFEVEDFGRLRRAAPTRDVTKNQVRLCETQPRYRLDGTRIMDEREFNMRIATEGLMQDLKNMIVTGNAAIPGQFDGLNSLVRTNYTDFKGRDCNLMDSIVINWIGNTMAGGAGITWNGLPVGANFALYDVLRAVIRRLKQRISWSPALAAQPLNIGDIVIMLPNFLVQCLLDHYTCWSVCEGSQYNESNINTLDARNFREGLNGGLFGDGFIKVDGFIIPLVAYDWSTITGANGQSGDIFVLTGSVGNIKTLMGEYNNMTSVPSGYPEAMYFSTDGGRLLGWIETDETCVKQTTEFQPRLVSWAPFLNVRFMNVGCSVPGGPISPDPFSSFFPVGSFSAAEC